MLRALTTAAASLALVAAPVAQAATPARAAPPVAGPSEMGGNSFPLPGLLVLLAIIAGAIFIVQDDEDSPDSP
jgi:hypothetical protein